MHFYFFKAACNLTPHLYFRIMYFLVSRTYIYICKYAFSVILACLYHKIFFNCFDFVIHKWILNKFRAEHFKK